MQISPERIQTYKSLPLEERLSLSLRENLSDEERALILHHEQWMQIRVYFSRRFDLRPDEVSCLLQDQDHVIRLSIAKRPDLSAKQVEICVTDRDPNVRYFIARNPLLDAGQRARLHSDEDELVRRAAGKGPRECQTRQRPGQARLIR